MSHRRSCNALVALCLCAIAFAPPLSGQSPAPGFTLVAPFADTNTYLVDDAGTIVHTWSGPTTPSGGTYLLEDGSIIRAANTTGLAAGAGGAVQRIGPDGTLLWNYDLTGPGFLQHHDLAPMPNGNVLAIVWDEYSPEEAIAAGRDPLTITDPVFLPDRIIEIQPTGPTSGDIVWEWGAWDHLIQDFDPSRENYGAVGDHPELIDLNFPPVGTPFVNITGDWMHANGLDYNPELDQIVLSVRTFSEIWIIDHSTTTIEAAGHTGGACGKGGDLIYRWGNPQAYRHGTPADQQLFVQHDANWIVPGRPGEGNIMVFNNQAGGTSATYSSVFELVPPLDGATYTYTAGVPYEPVSPVWSYTAPTPSDLFSPITSGAERLKNGNTLICAGLPGSITEIDPSGQTVFSYQNSLPGAPLPALLFKVRRYEQYLLPVTESLSVSAGGTAELNVVAGSSNAGMIYFVLGSSSGTAPEIPLTENLSLPLNGADLYFDITLYLPNLAPLGQTVGVLDASGNATATFTLPPMTDPALAGLELHHAFVVIGPAAFNLASNARPLALVP